MIYDSQNIISVDWFLTGHGIPLMAVATSSTVFVYCRNLPKNPLSSGLWSIIYSRNHLDDDEFTFIKWLANGRLFVASKKQNIIIEKYLFRQGLIKPNQSQSAALEESLFELASHFDGALPSFHPALLKEYLIWSMFYCR